MWKEIAEFAGYSVSEDGYVMNAKGKIMKPRTNNKGYSVVSLYKNKKHHTLLLHRIIATAFIPNDDPELKDEIDHIDKDRSNNSIQNLRWIDRVSNCLGSKRGQYANNTTGVKGIYFRKDTKKWYAIVEKNFERIYSPCFEKKEDAIIWLEEQKNKT